jgi:hypothetical protein
VADELERVTAYDTNTGEKLPAPVPRRWLRIFPHLSETPRSAAMNRERQNPKETTDA